MSQSFMPGIKTNDLLERISKRRTEMSFTRMDQGAIEDWMAIGAQCAERQSRMPAIIKSMLGQLEGQVDGFAINQLQHGLQTATRAFRDGASEELTVAALCHDIGKVISLENHPAIAAEILKPYVSQETYDIIRTHQDFQGKHYYALMGRDPDARRKHEGEAWYELARKFTDEWDQTSFDPAYDTLPLEHFEPMIDRVFSKKLFEVSASAAM
jgi:predicted HD phosphohydrolase